MFSKRWVVFGLFLISLAGMNPQVRANDFGTFGIFSEPPLAQRVMNTQVDGDWEAGSRLCTEWFSLPDESRKDPKVDYACIKMAFAAGSLAHAGKWLMPCERPHEEGSSQGGHRYIENFTFDLLQLNADLSSVDLKPRQCVIQALGFELVAKEQCHDAFLLARELYSLPGDTLSAFHLWTAARKCREATKGAPANVALFVPLAPGSVSSKLAPFFRGFQLAAMSSGAEPPRVLDSALLASGQEGELLTALWNGDVGGILSFSRAPHELARLKELFREVGTPIGVLPSHHNIADDSEPVVLKDGLIELRRGKKSLRASMLSVAQEELGVQRILWITPDTSLEIEVDRFTSSVPLESDFVVLENGVRGDKSPLRDAYRKWSKDCKLAGQGCAIGFDVPSRDAAHLLPYLELEGIEFCASRTQQESCVRVLGRHDWNRGNGGDATGRKMDGSLFAVEFDHTSSLPEVREFTRAFQERFSRAPSTEAAIVYTLFQVIRHWLNSSSGAAIDSPSAWSGSDDKSIHVLSALGPLALEVTPEKPAQLSRVAHFLMTMEGDQPCSRDKNKNAELPEILEGLGDQHD